MRKSYFVFAFFILSLVAVSKSYAQPSIGWIQRYNGLLDSIDVAKDIAIDNSGDVYVTGYSYTLLGLLTDIVTIKYRGSDGAELWRAYYRGLLFDEGNKIVVDNNYNVYVTGFSYRLPTVSDYITIKYNASGVQQWVQFYTGTSGLLSFDEAKSLALDRNGNVYVTGYVTNGLLPQKDYATVKYYPNGIQAWDEIYDDPSHGEDIAYDIAVDSDEGVFVTGSSQGSGLDMTTIKYYTYGGQVWARRTNGTNEEVGYAVVTDRNDNVIVTGYSRRSAQPPNDDYLTIKYNNDGQQQWSQFYSGIPNGGEDRAYALVVDNSDNVIVTGESQGQTSNNQDYGTVKYNGSNGNQLWEARYNGSGNGEDRAYALVVDNSDNVVVTGGTQQSGTGTDYGTVKYNGSNGNPMWFASYDSVGSEDRAYALVVDNSDNVIVTGSSRHGSVLGTEDYLTIKYGSRQPLVEINSNQTPSKFSLSQNYPNPFNPVTYIKFDVASQTAVRLSLYNVLGREMVVLVNQKLNPGSYEVSVNSEAFTSGIYFYRISMGDFTETKKMILVK